jgi:putative peptidoglycan binding protein
MSNLLFADAAYPAGISGGPYDGVAFYAGGDAYHVWTPAELAARPERYRLPIWVRSNPQGAAQATADAGLLLGALTLYGTPAGILVALDSETSADPAYVRAFVAAVNLGGHHVIDYGSQSTVAGNANPDGYYWGADWTDVAHLHSGDTGTQYVSFSGYDLSEMASELPFWDIRGGTLPSAAVSNWTETLVNTLPTLAQGATGEDVRTVQGCLCARGHAVTIDGVYGLVTASAVRAFQSASGITADSVTGPAQTWPKLLNR